MVLSKALPINFKQSGQTYNQSIQSLAGVMSVIWNQKWNSTDEIPLQFYDELLKGYQLRCYDEDENQIGASLPFVAELLNGIYIYSLTFDFATDFGVTDQVVHLKILDVYADITGAVEDTMETGDGELTFVDTAMNRSLEGDVEDTMETGDGDIVNAQSDLFGTSAITESGACTFDTTLYWESGVTWGPGVTMYTDAALTSPLLGEDFISLDGEIYNINSATGVVGATTGLTC